jgi:ABC-type transport system involved in cytochrome bd biosynthesis fused ATPase/permease subunit
MFNKRLLQEFTSLMPKVRQMVLIKWIALLANLVIIYGISNGLIVLFEKGTNPAWYLQLLILFLVAVVVRSFAHHVQGMISVHTSEQVKEHLRIRIFDKLSRLGKHYQKEISTSEVVQISTEGTEQLEIYFGKYMPQFFYSLLAPLTLFVVVSFFSIKIGFILFICVPLIPISIVAVQKIAKRILNKYWGAYVGLGDTFLESLQGLTTLKIFDQDQAYEEKMGKEAENFRKITMRVLIMQLNSISIMDLGCLWRSSS